jgi:hypothetical protein
MVLSIALRDDMRRFAVVAQGSGIGQEAVSDLSIGRPGITLHEPAEIDLSIERFAGWYPIKFARCRRAGPARIQSA